MGKTKIEWTATKGPGGKLHPGYSFNPWWGCVKVSPGCKNCYAETWSNRMSKGRKHWGAENERRFFGNEHWDQPLRWDRKAQKLGVRLKAFCGSMCDFAEKRDGLADIRADLGRLVNYTPFIDWLLLTKRQGNLHFALCEMGFLKDGQISVPDNAWLGVSVENQEQADRRTPALLSIKAKVRFLSIEPLLEEINLGGSLYPSQCVSCNNPNPFYRRGEDGVWRCPDCGDGSGKASDGRVDWVIVGGESGSQARPMDPAWAQSIRSQCSAAGVPFFFKQWGEWAPVRNLIDGSLRLSHMFYGEGDSEMAARGFDILDFPAVIEFGQNKQLMARVGKNRAGRYLAGQEWSQSPEVEQYEKQ